MKGTALSHFNRNHLSGLSLPEEVTIYDSTLRDGEQMPGISFGEAKLDIAKMLSDIGVPQIEAGFPAVSVGERDMVGKIAKLGLDSEILALSRTCRPDIDAALDCDVDMVMLFTASSDLHLEHKYRMTREQQLDKVTDALEYARSHGLRFSFSTEDSTRTDFEYLVRISKIAESLGAARIGLSDTTGCIIPCAMGGLVKSLASNIKAPISVHLHNDFGLALPNALASIENGATAVATTVNGMGERAGNVPTEMLAMALEQLYGIRTGIDLSGLTKLCGEVSRLSGVPISPNHPWVGENVFRHESGIHVAAILSDPRTYECIQPEVVGGMRELVLGKHSGRTSVRHRLNELGVSIPDDEVDRVVSEVKRLAQDGLAIDDAALLDIAGRHGGGD